MLHLDEVPALVQVWVAEHIAEVVDGVDREAVGPCDRLDLHARVLHRPPEEPAAQLALERGIAPVVGNRLEARILEEVRRLDDLEQSRCVAWLQRHMQPAVAAQREASAQVAGPRARLDALERPLVVLPAKDVRASAVGAAEEGVSHRQVDHLPDA